MFLKYNFILRQTLFFITGLGIAFLAACDISDGSGVASGRQDPDPVIVDFPIAFVERTIPVDEDGERVPDNILEPDAFNPGARLILKDRATGSAPERVLTEGIFVDAQGEELPYDVKDLTVSEDGLKLLFAMRAPELENVDEEDQPTWNIWQYNPDPTIPVEQHLRRIIAQNIFAEQGNDVAPQYLPDGRIIFSSDRQERTGEILIDEGKSKYAGLDDDRENEAFVLHAMRDDGTEVEQLSYNASHDLQPTVIDSGEVVYLRWDAIAGNDELSLYKINPDGSQMEAYYGFHSQNTGTEGNAAVFSRPRQLENGQILVTLRERSSSTYGGDLITIDTANFTNNTQPTAGNAGAAGPAQASLTNNGVDTRNTPPSLSGYYGGAFPLYDGTGRLLVTWSPCRLVQIVLDEIRPCTELLLDQLNTSPPAAARADPLFGLWIFDAQTNTQLPVKVPEEGIMYTDPVVLAARPPAAVYMAQDLDPERVNEQLAVMHIRNVYDIDGTDTAPDGGIASQADPTVVAPDNRQARFIRVVKNVPIPDENVLDFDNAIFGGNTALGMRDIIGYVPVEPDGSAKFLVPADMPFMVDVLDASGKRLHERHHVWITMRPGEERECTGCHTGNSELPHGRADAEAMSVYPGATGGIPFNNSQLFDSFGTPQPAPEFGESMAEYYARLNGPRTPSVDLIYTDEWSDPGLATRGTDIALRYTNYQASISANPQDPNCTPRNGGPLLWEPPTDCTATGSWDAGCRITINYVEHIQPLWTADRRTCDDMQMTVTNVTCTDCHNRLDAAGNAAVPMGQLELTGAVSEDENDYITSYAELFFEDEEQILDGMSLINLTIDGQPLLNADGTPQTDELGNPLFEQVTVPVPVPLNKNGALSNNRFFSLFEPGGSHFGRLSADELKLISEWLDIGGQYYNNPFDAPQD